MLLNEMQRNIEQCKKCGRWIQSQKINTSADRVLPAWKYRLWRSRRVIKNIDRVLYNISNWEKLSSRRWGSEGSRMNWCDRFTSGWTNELRGDDDVVRLQMSSSSSSSSLFYRHSPPLSPSRHNSWRVALEWNVVELASCACDSFVRPSVRPSVAVYVRDHCRLRCNITEHLSCPAPCRHFARCQTAATEMLLSLLHRCCWR